MTNKNKILSLTTIAAISAILLVSVPGTAFGNGPQLILEPDSFTGTAVPGEVINLPFDLVFPFEADDQIFGIITIGECDFGFSFTAQNPTQNEIKITANSVITIPSSAVIGDLLHCKTSIKVTDAAPGFELLGVAEFNIWITVIRGQLVITPDSIILDAIPGQAILQDFLYAFPFEDDDQVVTTFLVTNCVDGIDFDTVVDPIDGTLNIITVHQTTIIASDVEIGSSFHCEFFAIIVNDDINQVSPSVPFTIWVNVLAPEDLIQVLSEDVGFLDLNNGNTKSLSKKLEQAINNITNEDPTDDAGACGKLQSFINQLNAFVNAGKITQGEAGPLIDVAEALIDSLCQD